MAWKYFEKDDLESATPWFARRGELRLEAYRTRRSLINGQLQWADARLKAAEQQIGAAYASLKQRFPDLNARVLRQIKQARLPARPLEFSSAMSVQKILLAQQSAQLAAWKKAAANHAQAARLLSSYRALDGVSTPMAQANTLRLLRWSLASQRQSLARQFSQSFGLLLFAEQDLAARRAELRLAEAWGEAPAALIVQKATLAEALDVSAGARAELGQADAAERELAQAIVLRGSLPRENPESSLAAPLQSLGRIHFQLGQVRPARGFYLRALAEIERVRAASVARQGRAATAKQRESLRARSASSEGVALNNLATITLEAGDFKEAFALLDRAARRFESIPQSPGLAPLRRSLLATTRNNRAVLLHDSGQAIGAAEQFEAVARERRADGDDQAAATALLNAAGSHHEAGQADKAQAYATQARALFASAQDLRGLAAITGFLSDLEREAEHLEAAEKLALEAIRIAQATGDISWIASAQRRLARLKLAQKRPTEALQVLAETRTLDDKIGAPLASARTLELEGDALHAQVPAGAQAADATRQAAIARYQAAITLIESVRASTEQSAFADQQSSYSPYQSLVALLIEAGRAEEAFDYLQRAKSKALYDSLRLDSIKTQDARLQVLLERVQAAEDRSRATRAALQTEQAQRPAERDEAKIAALRQAVASTQGEFRRLQYELRAKNPNFDRILSIDPALLKDAQGSIPPDTALVQYAPLGDRLYIFVVTRESLKVFSPPVKPADLDAGIREFRRLMDQARQKFQDGQSLSVESWSTQPAFLPLRDNLTGLYSMLIEPIQDEIKGKSTVVFVPTQLLYYLPLHALAHQTPAGLRFLIQDKRVAYLSSAKVFVRPSAGASMGSGMVALGDPKGADLPFSGEEARSVARVFRAAKQEAEVVSGEGATKQALLAPANRSRRVWHLATHGFLNQADPMRSYIQLAPSADAPKGDVSTAKLTLEEVWGLDLNRVDLVTLSACETALGERNPDGKEVTSLASSFSDAGAKSVLASLWSVADDSTSTLMTGFYRSLAAGKSKAQSLQDAELALLKNPETNHPFFWAPFMLMGDWR